MFFPATAASTGRFCFELPWPKRDERKAAALLRAALQVNPGNLHAKLFLAELLAGQSEAGAREGLGLLEEVLAARPGTGVGPQERAAQQRARALRSTIEEKSK